MSVRALPPLFVLVLSSIASAAGMASSIHQRIADGWCLIAIETDGPPYTACAYLPTGESRWPGASIRGSGTRARSRVLDGRTLLRADADRAGDAIAALSSNPMPENAGGHTLDSHILELTRIYDRVRPASFPVLLVAGPEPAADSMARLVSVADALPYGHDLLVPTPAPLRPRWGWWRHVEDDGDRDVSVGVTFPSLSPAERPAMHMLMTALTTRLAAREAGAVARELLIHEGVVFRIAWPNRGAEDVPRLRALVRETMAELASAEPDSVETVELLASASRAIRRERANADRWFAREIIGASMGETRSTNHETLAALDDVTGADVRRIAAAHLPPDVLIVSRSSGAPSEFVPGPAEWWPGGRPEPDAAGEWVMGRLRRTLWGSRSPSGICTRGEWELVAETAAVSGVLEESIGPTRARRRFTPLGTMFRIEAWLEEGEVGGTVLGEARRPGDDQVERLEARRAADPWNLVRTPLGKVHVTGGTSLGGKVYQRVEISGEGVERARLYLDPETGLPERVVLGEEGASLVPTSFRFFEYESREGLTYPKRIERLRGPNPESVLRLTAWEPCDRLAGVEPLQ